MGKYFFNTGLFHLTVNSTSTQLCPADQAALPAPESMRVLNDWRQQYSCAHE